MPLEASRGVAAIDSYDTKAIRLAALSTLISGAIYEVFILVFHTMIILDQIRFIILGCNAHTLKNIQ